MSGSEFTEITYDKDGHVGIVTINRPEARNAAGKFLKRDLRDQLAPELSA